MSNAYEQFENQRELARMQRRHHGAETELDKAEVRHDAIFKWVWNARTMAPLMLITLTGWIGAEPGRTWVASLAVFWVTHWIAVAIGRAWNGLVGKFRDQEVLVQTQHKWMMIFGVLQALMGFGVGPGMILAGIIHAATPYVWTRWGRNIYQNTDYSRLKASMREPEAPRLYE